MESGGRERLYRKRRNCSLAKTILIRFPSACHLTWRCPAVFRRRFVCSFLPRVRGPPRPTTADQVVEAVALWKMEGYTTEEIAAKLGCAPRSVERKLRLIRGIWEKETA